MSDEEAWEEAKRLARKALCDECEWGDLGNSDPDHCLDRLLGWIANLTHSVNGHPSGAYRGTAELEREAQEEFERLRRILNRGIESASRGSVILNPGYSAWDEGNWRKTVDTVRADAIAFCDRRTAEGEPFVGAAYPVVYTLARFPYGRPSGPLPSFTEVLRVVHPSGAVMHDQMVKSRRAGFLNQLKRVPEFLLPRPMGTRQKACLSIITDIPIGEERMPLTAKSVVDIIEAEARRINVLTRKLKI
jgi:hypothetical protein